MGELHLEIIVDRLKREFKVDANVGKPEVAYRETILRKVDDVDGQASSGRPAATASTATCASTSSRASAAPGFVFENDIVGGVIPKEFIPSDREGHQARRWAAASSPATRSSTSRSRLYDGSYHEVDSSGPAFEVAGSMAFQDGAKKAGHHLLEPIMSGRGRRAPRTTWATSSATSTRAAARSST